MENINKFAVCEKTSRQLEEVAEALKAGIVKPLDEDVALIHQAFNDETGWAFAEKYSQMVGETTKLCDEILFLQKAISDTAKIEND